MRAKLEVTGATVLAPGGRPLFDGLTLRLTNEHVALVGRNGVGKSTLLAVLAGLAEPEVGRVRTTSAPCFVPQSIVGTDGDPPSLSLGQARRRALAGARDSQAEILLLDEPTEDLDEEAVAWLRDWLRAWPGCLVVASHDRRLLGDFQHFFLASESGCRAFSGTLDALDVEMERDHQAAQERYVRNLHRLAEYEAHTAHVARRKARKKRYGRCSELDRGTPRVRLNQKRSDAQVSHGRLAAVREARLRALREWSQASRRAMSVRLSVEVQTPVLTPPSGDVVVLTGVSARAGERELFREIDLTVRRDRVALVGPNGAGKTTLLGVVLGRTAPATGLAKRDLSKIGAIAQGGTDWMLEESLLASLRLARPADEPSGLAELVVAHRFPLALAERPLRSLSPGERTRAALMCLFLRSPAVEVLVLDEPTYSLDLVGQGAMTEALRAWPGGLIVATHDRAFLEAIGVDRVVEVAGSPCESRASEP